MGERASVLADRFHEARQAFISTIEGLSPEQMQARCAGEQCTVSALASHVAGVHALAAGWVDAVVRGESLPGITMDDVNHSNQEQFARDANRGKDEILQELRTNGEQAEQALRRLSDADLDRTAQFPLLGGEVTTQSLVEYVLIGDVEGHHKSITAATQ